MKWPRCGIGPIPSHVASRVSDENFVKMTTFPGSWDIFFMWWLSCWGPAVNIALYIFVYIFIYFSYLSIYPTGLLQEQQWPWPSSVTIRTRPPLDEVGDSVFSDVSDFIKYYNKNELQVCTCCLLYIFSFTVVTFNSLWSSDAYMRR